MPRKVTLREITKLAGVSVPTVSRVMRNSSRVQSDVAGLVREAAARLGATPPAHSKQGAIAFLLSNRDITHPFHSHVMRGAEAYCAERGYPVLFMTVHYPLRGPVSQLPGPKLLDRREFVSGFIVAGINSPDLINLLLKTKLPCSVFGNTVTEKGPPEPCCVVSVDDFAASVELTQHLIELGHRSICWVGDARQVWFRKRADGYADQMARAGLDPRVVSVEASDEQQVGYVATRSILAARPWPTAIASGNDRVAHGVYEALRDFGISPGREISVAGFNDTLEAVILHPTLTTVRVFPEQIGRKLAEQVISRIENADTAPERVVIPTQVIRRESCVALRVSNGAA